MSRPGLSAVNGDPAQDHAAVDELLTWYVNGTLEAAGIRRVESHLQACDACRERERAERGIAMLMQDAPVIEIAPQAGLASVLQRIERRVARRRRWLAPWRALTGDGTQRPLVLAVGIQAVVIVMLAAGVLWMKLAPAPGVYRTLSSPAVGAGAAHPGAALVRVVLDDSMTLGELRRALSPWHSRIVAGPEARGIYTVSIEGETAAVLGALRATRGVRLAEVVADP
jgi:anti-sigma factor RsiW